MAKKSIKKRKAYQALMRQRAAEGVGHDSFGNTQQFGESNLHFGNMFARMAEGLQAGYKVGPYARPRHRSRRAA